MKGTSTYVEKWSNISAYELNCVDFSFDGKLVAYGGADGLTIASADSGHLDAVVKHQHVPVTALAWLQSGSIVCAFSDGIIVQILPLETRVDVSGLVAPDHSIKCIAVDVKGSALASGSASDICVWKYARNGRWMLRSRMGGPRMFQDNKNQEVVITSIHWGNQEGSQLLVSYRHHGVQIWDVATSSVIANILNTSTPLGRTCLSPDLQHLAVVMHAGIDVHNINKKIPSASLQCHGGIDNPVTFVHNGEVLMAPCDRGKARLWSVLDGSRLQTLNHIHHEDIIALAEYNNNGTRLFRVATVSSQRVHLWETVMDGPKRRCCGTHSLIFVLLPTALVALAIILSVDASVIRRVGFMPSVI